MIDITGEQALSNPFDWLRLIRLALAVLVFVVSVAGGIPLGTQHRQTDAFGSFTRLIGGIADLEYGMRSREAIKRAFAGWMFIHITAALVMYPALALHIWNSLYFGLRWLE